MGRFTQLRTPGASGQRYRRALAAVLVLAAMAAIAGVGYLSGSSIASPAYYYYYTAPTNLTLTPSAATNTVGTTHTVTATVTDANGNPSQDVVVRFTVTGSVSATGSCKTDSNGQCSFSYNGPQLPGADLINAFADTDNSGTNDGEPTASASKAWVLPASTAGQITGGGQIDVAGDVISFGFNAKSNGGLKGECTLVDHETRQQIKCTSVTSLVQSSNEATIFGDATVDGVATTYRIHVVDNGEPGRGFDTFSITTASGYSASGTLTGGNIQVH
jgi:hypothetical protein